MARSLNGSGAFEWPNGARVAVVITCLIENWSGDNGPPFSVQTTSLRPGTHDRAAMTWGTYGGRTGVWRLLKILNDIGAPATFAANARSLELSPRAVELILRSGHEIAAHSYTQDALMAYLSIEEQRAMIQKCIKIFEGMTGARPKGWISPVMATTEATEELVAEAGFLWYGDYNNVDLPFRVATKKGTLVALPHSDFADHRVLKGNTRDWFDVYKDTFDYLYFNEPTSYLNITLHSHFGGRPLMAAQFNNILKYIKGFPDIWIVRHDELAQWCLDNSIDEWTNEQRFFAS
jgi:peptidoglycan/xylan/chitin deacetylase (PgdA/CDA1 family)